MSQAVNIPLVLVHGWGASFDSTWHKPGIDALLIDIGRQVEGIDLLGHGTAAKPHDPLAYDQLGNWLLEQLPDGAPVVDILGFSLGALTTLDALVSRPDRFRKVLLAGIGDGVFDSPSQDRHQRIVDALEERGSPEDTFSQMFVQYANQSGNDRIALTAVMKRPPSPQLLESQLRKLNHQVRVVIGDKDFAGPADKLAASFPNGELKVLKNVDHFATTESFAFIDSILEFFSDE